MSTKDPNTRSARVKTSKQGVYYRELADGSRSYSIAFRAHGRLIWKTVPGGERDAVQARAKVISELGRGRKVAPTRQMFEEFATAWLEGQKPRLGERTIDQYERTLRLHLIPEFGRLRLQAISEDRIVALIRRMEKAGYKPWSVRSTLVPLGRVLSHAVRKGHLAENPLRNLESGERPTIERQEQRVLSTEEIANLLAAAPASYRPVIATAVLTGARQAETLGLTWADVDFERGVIRIRAQLSRQSGQRKTLKTSAATRDVVLTRTLAKVLREHKAASAHSLDEDYVFATATGRPLSWSNVVRRGLHEAVTRAKLKGSRPRWHDLRHTYASLLISQGADVVFVSRQLGHASPDITLRVYSHLFDAERHTDRFRELLDGALGGAVRGNGRVTRDGSQPKSGGADVVELSALGS